MLHQIKFQRPTRHTYWQLTITEDSFKEQCTFKFETFHFYPVCFYLSNECEQYKNHIPLKINEGVLFYIELFLLFKFLFLWFYERELFMVTCLSVNHIIHHNVTVNIISCSLNVEHRKQCERVTGVHWHLPPSGN